jgi:ATP-dependent Clp protease adaptor protein ClpS
MAGLGTIGTRPAPRQEDKLKEPKDYQVILLNDNYTTMEFVVKILVAIFQKNEEDANRIMLDIHQKGRGIVGLYPWDIARTKTEQVHAEAERKGFPLRCIVEEV